MPKLPIVCEFLDLLVNEHSVPSSSLAKRVRESNVFHSLLSAGAIVKQRKGAGYRYVAAKPEVIVRYRNHECPNDAYNPERGSRHNQVRQSRDSKTRGREESYLLAFLRSNTDFRLNGVREYGIRDNIIGDRIKRLETEKVCFIENLENFMEEKYLVEEGWVLLHPYGRIGSAMLENIDAKRLLHYGDLDFSGLNEYTRIKKIFPAAELYVPENYYEDALKYGKKIKTNQKPTNDLLELEKHDQTVADLLSFLRSYSLFFEQEGYSDV